MAKGPRYSVKFRRRREHRTDYSKRRKLLQSKIQRFVVRKSNKYITVQLIEYLAKGDKTLATINSKVLKKLAWKYSCKNIPASYLTGLLLSKKTKERKAILDIGLYKPVKSSKLFAALKGAIDGGLEIKHDPKIFPSEDRLAGKHINKSMQADFDALKEKILGK